MHAAQRPYLPHGTSWCVSQQPCLQGRSDCLLDTCMDGVTAPDQFPGLLSLRNKHQGYCVASHNHCWEQSPAKRQGFAMLPIRWLCPNGMWGQLAAFSLSLLHITVCFGAPSVTSVASHCAWGAAGLALEASAGQVHTGVTSENV